MSNAATKIMRLRTVLSIDWLATLLGLTMCGVFILISQLHIRFLPKSLTVILRGSPLDLLISDPTSYAVSFAILLTLTSISVVIGSEGRRYQSFLGSFMLLWLLSLVVWILHWLDFSRAYGLLFPLWSLGLGMLLANVRGASKLLEAALQTDFYLKLGIVVLGATVPFSMLFKVGLMGLAEVLIVVSVIWLFAYSISRGLGLDSKLSCTLASSVSICGVCAPLATGYAVGEDAKRISYVISIALLLAIPMMLLMPLISKILEIPDTIAGAWIGTTIDTTSGVLIAGSLISPIAESTAAIVKVAQNSTISIVVLLIALAMSLKGLRERPGLAYAWHVYPKFVLGFIAASLLMSLAGAAMLHEAFAISLKSLIGLKLWLYSMAFICVGLQLNVKNLKAPGGGKPVAAYVIAQAVNVALALGLSYVFFG